MRTLALLALLLPTIAHAVPDELTHQGRLMDSSGVPLDGDHDISVMVYDVDSGGTAIWSQDFTAVPFDAGYYVLDLSGVDTTVFDGSKLWVELTVDGSALGNRNAIVSVPYALRADVTTDLDGGVVDASEVRVDGTTVIDNLGSIDAAAIGSGTLDVARIPAHDHDAAELVSGTVDIARLPVGASNTDVASGDHLHAITSMTGVLDISQIPVGGGATDVAAGDHGHSYSFADIGGTAAIGQLPVGTTSSDVAAGNHAHTAADVGALPASGGTLGGDLAVNGSVTVTGAPGTCNGGAAGSIALAGTQLQICDGTNWRPIALAPAGLGPADPAVSCAQILADYPTAGDGVYWLGSSGYAYEAYCDMAGGGWTLIMKTAAGDNTFQYTSAYWTNTNLLNAASLDTSAANAKLEAYNRVAFSEVRGCSDATGSLVCIEEDLSSVAAAPYVNATALFAGPELLLFGTDPAAAATAANAKRDEFYAVFGPTGMRDCLPKDLGFNITANDNNFARWGFANNIPSQGCQVTEPQDADGVIGWGLDGQDAGQTGAGWTNYFVNDTANGGQQESVDSWLWVR